jgi:CheY-like chemotaxis protein
MAIDDAVKLLDGVTRLLAVLLWPAIIMFLVIRFRHALGEFMTSLSEFSLKGGGFEASAKRRQAEAAAALGAAAAARPDTDSPANVSRDTRAAAELVSDVVTPRAIRRARNSKILWVDDRPNNNVHERQALEALGVTFVLATSTEEALDAIKRQSFDVIISDMGRPPDSQAGYTLLDRLRGNGDRTPFIIYAGSRAPEHRAEARRRGAIGCTNRPDELFEMTLSALRKNE